MALWDESSKGAMTEIDAKCVIAHLRQTVMVNANLGQSFSKEGAVGAQGVVAARAIQEALSLARDSSIVLDTADDENFSTALVEIFRKNSESPLNDSGAAVVEASRAYSRLEAYRREIGFKPRSAPRVGGGIWD